MTPSLCGGFLSDKRSLVAFTWTIATVMTLIAFLLAVILTCQVHAHYKRMEHYYESQLNADDYYRNNNNNNQNCEGGGENGEEGGEGCGSQDHNSADRQIEYLMQLSTVSSKSMTFVALYTMAMAVALSLCGSTAIVGFTSLRGDYIAPCFSSSGSSKLRLGIFGGAIVIFANLLLVCAVVFGEVRVSWGNLEEYQRMRLVSNRLVAHLWCTFSFYLRKLRRSRTGKMVAKVATMPNLTRLKNWPRFWQLLVCSWLRYTQYFQCFYFYTLETKKRMTILWIKEQHIRNL